MKRWLLVRRIPDDKIVHRVDVTGKGERAVDRILSGMLINLHHDYIIEDTADKENEA